MPPLLGEIGRREQQQRRQPWPGLGGGGARVVHEVVVRLVHVQESPLDFEPDVDEDGVTVGDDDGAAGFVVVADVVREVDAPDDTAGVAAR